MTGVVMATRGCGGGGAKSKAAKEKEEEQNQMRLMEYLLAALRKSMVSCRVESGAEDVISAVHSMDIGWPTNVRHVTHVTFDRFNGFLGLPVELQVEIPGRVPSASASVFGVSAESMQCSYDSKGNSVPTILLLMQERLYAQGGLKAEGIFRINAENSKEEEVRGKLNRGEVPGDIEVHCLAGLIKAWFRELPTGVLDGLSPDEVLECSSEEDCVALLSHLGPTETALLNWAVDLMADIVQHHHFNKMNARNIAMVFAPNMTQMSDPLTALMHAVQVMNLLKTLITKTLAEREEASEGEEGGSSPMSSSCSSDNRDDDEDLYSHHNMETGSEGNGQSGRHSSRYEDDDDHKDLYDQDHEDLYEVEVLGEIVESFSGHLDDEKPSANLEEEQEVEEKCVTLQCCSEISLTDSHDVSSGLTSINEVEEEEEECIDSAISLVEDTNTNDSREEDSKAEEENSSIQIVEKTSESEKVSHAPEESV